MCVCVCVGGGDWIVMCRIATKLFLRAHGQVNELLSLSSDVGRIIFLTYYFFFKTRHLVDISQTANHSVHLCFSEFLLVACI